MKFLIFFFKEFKKEFNEYHKGVIYSHDKGVYINIKEFSSCKNILIEKMGLRKDVINAGLCKILVYILNSTYFLDKIRKLVKVKGRIEFEWDEGAIGELFVGFQLIDDKDYL